MPPLDDRDVVEWDEEQDDHDFWLQPPTAMSGRDFTDMIEMHNMEFRRLELEREHRRILENIPDLIRTTGSRPQDSIPPQATARRYHPNRDERIAKHAPKSDGQRSTENLPLSNLSL
jgi:hypothetical protein